MTSPLPSQELLLEPLFYLIVDRTREVRGVVGRAEGILWYTPFGDPDDLRQMPLQGVIEATDSGEWTITLDIEQAEWWARLFRAGPRKESA
jgi:hypothetical protein